jgi:DNA replication and repair protein RecF
MVVTSLSLRDFRNYARADVELGPGLNVVCGPNGAGKTNLLEALYFSLTARSCRTSNEREVVRSGEKVTRVTAHVSGKDGDYLLLYSAPAIHYFEASLPVIESAVATFRTK